MLFFLSQNLHKKYLILKLFRILVSVAQKLTQKQASQITGMLKLRVKNNNTEEKDF